LTRIAILGWGSLIWDLDDLAPNVEGPWSMRAGPRLPMEFSRVSPKRLMGLVVALDPLDGVACPTHAIRSRRTRLADAIADLAARERAPASASAGPRPPAAAPPACPTSPASSPTGAPPPAGTPRSGPTSSRTSTP
jgi:hypothetical protein